MAEKTLNTRILLKYDSYENWVSNNPVLKAGELAIATLETNKDGVQSAPTVVIKVGDGTSDYKTLKFVSGIAADVYDWAKASVKPVYKAEEITGIDERIANYVSNEMGIEVDTDTQYNIVKVNEYQYKLMSKSKGDESFATEVAVIDIPKYDDTTVKADITSLKGLVGETAVATQIGNAITALDLANTYAAKSHKHVKADITDFAHNHEMSEVNGLVDALAGKEAAGEAAKVQDNLDAYIESNDGVIAGILNGEGLNVSDGSRLVMDSFKDVEYVINDLSGILSDALALKADAEHTHEIADVNGLQDALDAKGAKSDVEANAGKIATLEGKVATLEASGYDDTEVRGLIKDNADAIAGIKNGESINDFATVEANMGVMRNEISTLTDNSIASAEAFVNLYGGAESEDLGKSIRQIANEELAKQLIAEDAAENLNSLEEIAAWIQSHPGDASAMNAAIVALQNQLIGIDAGNGTVKKYVDDAIAALNVGQYALAADLTALATRVKALEDAGYQNASQVGSAIDSKIEALDLANTYEAKGTAAGLNSAMDARVQVVEGKAHEHSNLALLETYTQTEANLADAVAKKHSHSNASVLDGITAAKVSAWDAAEANAEAHADGLNSAMDTRVKALEALPTNTLLDTDTFIFDCGNSNF